MSQQTIERQIIDAEAEVRRLRKELEKERGLKVQGEVIEMLQQLQTYLSRKIFPLDFLKDMLKKLEDLAQAAYSAELAFDLKIRCETIE